MAVFVEMTRELSRRKNIFLFSLLCAGLLVTTGCVPASYGGGAGSQEPVNDVQYLESYGEWFDMPPYGSVWRPFVVSDWAPFSHGHWMWTNDGWAWVSYEPFGWLVYHYGFWDYRQETGWFWVPGDTWSPANVEWSTFGNYCAWAPLPPPDMSWPEPWEPFDTNVWIVVPIDNFTDDDVGRSRLTIPLPRDLAKRETVRRQPPDVKIIRQRGRKSLDPVIIRKEPVEIRTRPLAVQPRSIAPRVPIPRPPEVQPRAVAPSDTTLERMILPRNDKRKVEKYSPEILREVLAPRKASPPPEQKPAERKPDTVRTRNPLRR
jgi:hypothetical protein